MRGNKKKKKKKKKNGITTGINSNNDVPITLFRIEYNRQGSLLQPSKV